MVEMDQVKGDVEGRRELWGGDWERRFPEETKLALGDEEGEWEDTPTADVLSCLLMPSTIPFMASHVERYCTHHKVKS